MTAPASPVVICITVNVVKSQGLLGGSEGRVSACNVGDLGLIPRSGRSPGEGNGYLLWYSCLENSMHIGA